MIKSIVTIALSLCMISVSVGQNGVSVTPKSVNTQVFTIVDPPHEFVGGDVALYTYVYRKLKFPPDPEMVECTVYVEFVVNEDGSLSNVSVKKGFSRGYNEEAMKVVASMPKWRSGTHEGQPIRVARTVPIRFKLF
jgi:TonB family protein